MIDNFDPSKLVIIDKNQEPAKPAADADQNKGQDGNPGDSGNQPDDANKGQQNNNAGQNNNQGDEGSKGDEGNGGESNDDDAPEITEDDLNPIIEEYFEGKVKGLGDIQNLIAENERLKAELENKPLTFPSEGAKKLYEFAQKFQGSEMESARSYLHVLSLDLDKASEKDVQFEAFALDRPDLSREDARKIFEAKYTKLYGDDPDALASDPLLSDEHKLATRDAKAKLKKAQDEFQSAAKSSQPDANDNAEDVKQFQTGVSKVLGDFAGITIDFDGKDELTFDLTPEQEKDFSELAANPDRLLSHLFDDCVDANGNVDYRTYASELFQIINRKQIIQEAKKHGFELGKLEGLKELKNSGNKNAANTGGKQNPPKPTFQDALLAAVAGK